MTTVLQLKPCPCCGSDRIVSQAIHDGFDRKSLDDRFYVQCRQCHIKLETNGVEFSGTEEIWMSLAKRWNRRPEIRLDSEPRKDSIRPDAEIAVDYSKKTVPKHREAKKPSTKS
jgi:hypothetical protein